ncbi:MAG: hypothetical protein MZV49_16750 [Rhodopseudomonas palustris]|nr:hypothetical protein [Rhodopseudomonas palustris]
MIDRSRQRGAARPSVPASNLDGLAPGAAMPANRAGAGVATGRAAARRSDRHWCRPGADPLGTDRRTGPSAPPVRASRHRRGAVAAAGADRDALRDGQLPLAAASGLLPLRHNGELLWTVAPRRLAARTLCQLTACYPSTIARLRVASTASLRQFMERHGAAALAELAIFGLQRRCQNLSAAPQPGDRPGQAAAARARRLAGAAAAACCLPMQSAALLSLLLFLSFVGFRLVAAMVLPPPPSRCSAPTSRHWPTYTVIVALVS